MGKKPKVDWIYHYVANGVECAECGKVEHPFPEQIGRASCRERV